MLAMEELEDVSVAEEESVDRAAAMTWLQAAEQVLREEGPVMHIRELTARVMALGMVNSSCTTSLETLLYRQTSRGPPGVSKFVRVPGKMGHFGLSSGGSAAGNGSDVAVNSALSQTSLSGVATAKFKPVTTFPREGPTVAGVKLQLPVFGGGAATEMDFEPQVTVKRKRPRMYSSEASSASSSDEEEEEEEEVDEVEEEEEEEEEDSESSTDEEMEPLYYKRYHFVKKLARTLIFENAALASQLHAIEEGIAKSEAERKFLLQRLVHFERKERLSSTSGSSSAHKSAELAPKSTELAHKLTASATPTSSSHSASRPPNVVVMVPKGHPSSAHQASGARKTASLLHSALTQNPSSKGLSLLTPGHLPSLTPLSPSSSSDSSKSEGDELGSGVGLDPAAGPLGSGRRGERRGGRGGGEGGERGESLRSALGGSSWRADGETSRSSAGASRRAKKGSKVRRLHPIPLGKDGNPVYPIQVGGLKVYSLGKVVYNRVAYHTERYILPVGFESSRVYPSMNDPQLKCTYICRILDGGEVPLFEMIAEDDPTQPIRAASSTACQTQVLKAINKARDKQASNSGSGPEFFGYSTPTIQNLIQSLPNAEKCTRYKFVKFEAALKSGGGGKSSQPSSKKGKLAKLRAKVARGQSGSPRTFNPAKNKSSPLGGGGGGLLAVVKARLSPGASDPSLTPVLGSGSGLIGSETSANLCSSSDDWSSDSDTSEKGLIIDG